MIHANLKIARFKRKKAAPVEHLSLPKDDQFIGKLLARFVLVQLDVGNVYFMHVTFLICNNLDSGHFTVHRIINHNSLIILNYTNYDAKSERQRAIT